MPIRTEGVTRRARVLAGFLTADILIERPQYSIDTAGNVRATWLRVATVKGRVLPVREKKETPIAGSEAGHESYRLIVAPGSDVQAKDRVTAESVVYEVVQVDTARTDGVDVQATVRRAT